MTEINVKFVKFYVSFFADSSIDFSCCTIRLSDSASLSSLLTYAFPKCVRIFVAKTDPLIANILFVQVVFSVSVHGVIRLAGYGMEKTTRYYPFSWTMAMELLVDLMRRAQRLNGAGWLT
jgi:hypothetical protein